MSILSVTTGSTGTGGVLPGVVKILTTDTEAAILTTGYLNLVVQNGASFPLPCLAEVSTKASSTSPYQVGWYQVSHVGSNWSLIPAGSPGDVTLPTIANHIAVFNNTTGTMQDDVAIAINGGSLQAGLSGTAGSLISFPSTAAKGSLILSAVANTGNTNVTISNAAHGQATVYSIGDIGASTGGLVAATSALRMKAVAAAAYAGGSATATITDAFCTSGSTVVANWQTSANAVNIQKVTAGNGSFVVLNSADPGVSTLNYIITK